VTEHLIDKAAGAIGLSPEEMRRRTYTRKDEYPYTHPTGIKLEALSHHECLERIIALMDLPALRAEQARRRSEGIYRGIGLAAFVEVTAPGPAAYGNLGIPTTTQDSVTLRVEPSGQIRCFISVTEQGQGTETVIGQIVAEALGVTFEDVFVFTGDSAMTPYGGGAWASRGTAIGGELALQAAKALRRNILDCAAPLLQTEADALTMADGMITASGGAPAEISLSKLADMVHFRPQLLPQGAQRQLAVTQQFGHDWPPYVPTNGIQASHVEVDVKTGHVRLLGHWAVDDFGTIINPMLVAEQVRGGIVQGIGEALFEEIIYDDRGQLTNGSFVDYLLPKASEMPDIIVDHVETPWPRSELGAKGAGEAGMTGALAAVLNAVNDALQPFGRSITSVPITPSRILQILGKISA
jgi:carbon-monoxide dehydrogenase large subunit